jgi:hypothetical protein
MRDDCFDTVIALSKFRARKSAPLAQAWGFQQNVLAVPALGDVLIFVAGPYIMTRRD